MKLSEGRKLVALVQAAYPRQPWPDPTVNLFAEELSRLPVAQEQAEGAIRRMLRERAGEFAPSIGEILRAIVDGVDGAPSFGQAWAEMSRRASEGNYFAPEEPPAFSHPAISRLALQLGWGNFCRSDSNDTYFRHQAERLYAGVLEDRVRDLLLSPEHLHELGPGGVPAGVRELVAGIGGEG